MKATTFRSTALIVLLALLAAGLLLAANGVLVLPRGHNVDSGLLQRIREAGIEIRYVDVQDIPRAEPAPDPNNPPGDENCYSPAKGGIGSQKFLRTLDKGQTKYFAYTVRSYNLTFSARLAVMGDEVLFATTWHDARLWFFSRMPLKQFLMEYQKYGGNTLFDRLWNMANQSPRVSVEHLPEDVLMKRMGGWDGSCP